MELAPELTGVSPTEMRSTLARFATGDRHPLVLPDHFAAEGTEPDYVRMWPSHCVAGTPGADFHPALVHGTTESALFDAVVDKGRSSAAYSGFEGKDHDGTLLAGWLRERSVEEVDVCGIATDHCVRATALDAVREGFTVRLLPHLCAGVAPETTERALAEMSEAGVTVP